MRGSTFSYLDPFCQRREGASSIHRGVQAAAGGGFATAEELDSGTLIIVLCLEVPSIPG